MSVALKHVLKIHRTMGIKLICVGASVSIVCSVFKCCSLQSTSVDLALIIVTRMLAVLILTRASDVFARTAMLEVACSVLVRIMSQSPLKMQQNYIGLRLLVSMNCIYCTYVNVLARSCLQIWGRLLAKLVTSKVARCEECLVVRYFDDLFLYRCERVFG